MWRVGSAGKGCSRDERVKARGGSRNHILPPDETHLGDSDVAGAVRGLGHFDVEGADRGAAREE